MLVTITIETGNDDCKTDSDIARLLRGLANRVENVGIDYVTKVLDRNGNKVGTVETSAN